MKKSLLLLFLVSFLMNQGIQAQTTRGTEFWFSYINNLVQAAPQIFISAETNVNGTVEVPGIGHTQNFNVAANTTTTITLPVGTIVPYNFGLHQRGVRVTTCDTVSVYAVFPGQFSSDGTCVFPKTSLGSDYTVLNMTGNPGDWGDAVQIVATEDNTEIQITPSQPTGGNPAGVPFNVTLNEGDVYQLTHPNGNADLSGTRIIGVDNGNGSCKPFAVFCGARCINIGGCSACDQIYDQMIPNQNLGENYALIPLAQKNRTWYRVLAIENNTQVNLDGVTVANLNEGQFYQFNSNDFQIINANNPVRVAQFCEGVSCAGPGDPFMVSIFPIEQSIQNITFNAFQTPIVNNFWINVVSPTASINTVELDGNNIAGDFLPFPFDNTYSYARIQVTVGDHTISSDDGVLVTVYGLGNAESFGYCAGASMKDLVNDFDITSSPACANEMIDFDAVLDPDATNYTWDFGDGSPTQTGQNVSHQFGTNGSYVVTLTKEKQNACNIDVAKLVFITDPPISINQEDTILCAGEFLDLTVPVNEPVTIPYVNGCGDTVNLLTTVDLDSIYWSTGEVGDSIRIYPTTDTMIYVYGTNQGSQCLAIDSIFIEVDQVIPDFSWTPVCLGDTTMFTNLTTASINSVFEYTWDLGDGTITDSINPQHVYGTSGSFSVNLSVVNASNCQADTTLIAVVNPLPEAVITGDTAVCLNSTAPEITFTGSASTSPYTFTYTIDGGAPQTVTSTGDIATVSVPTNAVGTFVYELMSVVDASSTACEQLQTGTATVIVNPLPEAAIAGDTALCKDAAQPEITFTGSNATAPYTFTYTINGGASQTVTSTGDIATVLVPTNAAGTFTYELVSVQDASATACEQNQTGTATVVVNPLPEAAIAGDVEVCQDDTAPTITFTGSNSVAPYTFTYTINGGAPQTITSVGNTATITAPTDAVGTFTYELVSVQDASATACEQNQTGTVVVVVNPLPNVSFEGQDLIGCSPICPEITSTSTVGLGSNIVDYTWDFSNGESSSSPSPTYTECLDNYSGNPIYIGVTLTATTDKGCVASHSEANYIQVNHNPIADFTFSPENPDIINNKVDFANASSYADFYNWNFGGIGFSTETNPSFSFPEEGNQEYIVELIASTTEGCTDTVIAIINVADRIVFYVPNTFTPDKDDYNETFQPVFTSGFDPLDFHMLIFNRWGEIVFESFDADRGWDGTYGAANERIVKDGTYVWKIEFKETMSDKRHVHTGHVNILR